MEWTIAKFGQELRKQTFTQDELVQMLFKEKEVREKWLNYHERDTRNVVEKRQGSVDNNCLEILIRESKFQRALNEVKKGNLMWAVAELTGNWCKC